MPEFWDNLAIFFQGRDFITPYPALDLFQQRFNNLSRIKLLELQSEIAFRISYPNRPCERMEIRVRADHRIFTWRQTNSGRCYAA